MSEFYDKEGNVLEGFTADEADARAQEARNEAVEEANRLLEEKETAKQALEVELEELKRKDLNNGGLRKAVGAKEREIEELRNKINEVETGYKGKLAEIEGKQLTDVKETFISGVVGNDPKAKEKIEFYFNKFQPAKNKEELIENLKAASELAGKSARSTNQFSGKVVSSAGGNYSIPTDGSFGDGFDDKGAALDVAKKLGLSKADFEAAGYKI